jgi:hypothetical protein
MGRGKAQHNRKLIESAYRILEEIQPATVRAVCYRLFAAGEIDSMSKNNTNRVSTQLVYAREERIIPWDWIVDESRKPERPGTWSSVEDFAETARRSFRRDYWQTQQCAIEIWSEKGTVRGTLAPVLQSYGVTFQVFHGYGSATTVRNAALDSCEYDRPFKVFYVGDWDPSGLHMSEVDLPGRLGRYEGRVELKRIALTEQDIGPSLPSFNVDSKQKDSRWKWYGKHSVSLYGPLCWELDALNPVALRERVEAAILNEIHPEAWQRCRLVEQAEQDTLKSYLHQWEAICRQATK